MDYSTRKKLYKTIERDRDTRVLSFVTGTRRGLEIQIADDCMEMFVELLDRIGPTNRISLILHTNGGLTLAAWQLINLIRMFCEDLEVIVPLRALSAGTLIAIGANRIIMTKQATLGPIDPSISNPLNPTARLHGDEILVPVSVESVRGYLDVARKELGLKGEKALSSILQDLTGYVHPLVLGEIFRSQAQIRFLAEKLLTQQVGDRERVLSIIDFLCGDSGSHDYTINRREASELGLKAEKPSDALYSLLREIQISYTSELKLSEPFNYPNLLLNSKKPDDPVQYSLPRGLIEGTVDKHFLFVTEGVVRAVQTPEGEATIANQTTFEGWKEA